MKFFRFAVLLSLVLAVVFGNLSLPSKTYAQTPTEGLDLEISPLPIELTAKPGTSVGTDLRIRNAGTQDEKLQVRLLKVSEDNNGTVRLTNPGATDDWVHWVSFSKNVFDAPSNEWQTIHMTVNVPKSAAFGYYFAVEYLRASDLGPQAGQAVAHGAVATFILFNADAPGATRVAQIVGFSADRKSYEFLPVTFTVKISNTGNVHLAPYGNVFITKGSKKVGSIDINAAQGNVLPGGSRFFAASWSDGFPVYQPVLDASGQPVLDKKGNPKKSLKWDFSKADKLRFGHYAAQVVMVYDNGQRDVPMEATVQFWVIPWQVLGIFLVAGLLVLAGVWSVGRKLYRLVKRVKHKRR